MIQLTEQLTPTQPASKHEPEHPQPQYKVLIIDDEVSFLKSMKFLLTKRYHADVCDAKSGRNALKLIDQSNMKFDIVFIDIMLPGEDSLDIYSKISNKDTKIVMMSAYKGSDQWNQAKLKDIELLSKPISQKRLTKIFDNLSPR